MEPESFDLDPIFNSRMMSAMEPVAQGVASGNDSLEEDDLYAQIHSRTPAEQAMLRQIYRRTARRFTGVAEAYHAGRSSRAHYERAFLEFAEAGLMLRFGEED